MNKFTYDGTGCDGDLGNTVGHTGGNSSGSYIVWFSLCFYGHWPSNYRVPKPELSWVNSEESCSCLPLNTIDVMSPLAVFTRT